MEKKDIQQLIEAMKPVFATKEDLGVFPTAEMVNKGFEKTAEDFSAVHTRLDKIEKRLYSIASRLPENAIMRLEQVEQDITAIKKAIGMTS